MTFNLAAVAGDGLDSKGMEVKSNDGTFSLADLDFREGRGLVQLGLGDDATSVEFASLKIAFRKSKDAWKEQISTVYCLVGLCWGFFCNFFFFYLQI